MEDNSNMVDGESVALVKGTKSGILIWLTLTVIFNVSNLIVLRMGSFDI